MMSMTSSRVYSKRKHVSGRQREKAAPKKGVKLQAERQQEVSAHPEERSCQ